MAVQTGSATYSPEDNKLRLYVGRVPRDEYERLRDEGWTSTPKQDCDFVATWTPDRRDTALEYGDGVIEDEDQPMAERAADRAERFGGYRDKRTDEATGHADRYDSGPSVHGYQSQARAERAAVRHDRIADRAGDAWSKAEYWQRRTAGVISHALYKSQPGVRMGRIKVIEAELRKAEKSLGEYAALWKDMTKIAAMTDPTEQTAAALHYTGSRNIWSEYMHPRAELFPEGHFRRDKRSLYTMLRGELEDTDPQRKITGAEACALFFTDHAEPKTENDWTIHLRLRLAYELQMLDAQGGRAALVEMEPGGWIGNHQIRKVNKSNATGRVVSVTLKVAGDRWGNSNEGFHMRAFNIERLPSDAYRPPTAEDVASLSETKKAEKDAAPKKAPCPLINPTDADAEKLQALWNEQAMAKRVKQYEQNGYRLPVTDCAPVPVLKLNQSTYSRCSQGTYAKAETVQLYRGAVQAGTYYSAKEKELAKYGAAVCQVRKTGSGQYNADRVIVLMDKPQKPFPRALWKAIKEESYAAKVQALENEGLTTSDAQACVDAQESKAAAC